MAFVRIWLVAFKNGANDVRIVWTNYLYVWLSDDVITEDSPRGCGTFVECRLRSSDARAEVRPGEERVISTQNFTKKIT